MKRAKWTAAWIVACTATSITANADTLFQNLDQALTSFWGVSPNSEFGTTIQTGPQAVALNSITFECWLADVQTAPSLRVRVLKRTAAGQAVAFDAIGELGNPALSPAPAGWTRFVSCAPLSDMTLSANTEYLVAVSATPGSAASLFMGTTASSESASDANWQLGSDWLGFFGDAESWIPFDVAGNLKLSVDGSVVLNHAPDVSTASALNGVLWPPDGSLRPVEIVGINDPDGDPVQVFITAIEQDEPVGATGKGDVGPDAILDDTGKAWVKAERLGSGNGRVYKVHFTATDGKPGGTADGVIDVTVPHDMGRGALAIDDGPVTGYYDSTTR